MLRRALREYAGSYAGLPPAAWVLACVALVNRAGTMVLPFLTLYVTSELGHSPAEAANVFVMFSVGGIFGTLLGGRLADRLDARVIMATTLFANGLGYLALVWVQELGAMSVVLFFTGLAADTFRPASGAVIANACPPEVRNRAFALYRLGLNLGMSVGPAIGGLLAAVDYRLLFVIDGVTCALAALPIVLGRRFLPAGGRSAGAAEAPSRSPLTDGPFLAAMAGGFVVACLFFQLFSTWTLFLHQERGFNEAHIGALITVNTLFITVAQMPTSSWLSRRPALVVLGVGTMLLGASFALLPFGASWAYAAFAMVVFTLGEMATMPTMTAFVTDAAPAGAVGRYFGVFSFVMASAGIVAPWLGLRLYAQGGAQALWLGSGALGLLTGAGFVWASRWPRRASRTTR